MADVVAKRITQSLAPAGEQQDLFTARDRIRVAHQRADVMKAMSDGNWHTLRELARDLGHPEASISARLRELRSYGRIIEKQRARADSGLWLYRMLPC